MDSNPEKIQKKRPVKKIIAFSFLGVIAVAIVLLYQNFNRLLSDALLRSFNSSIISDVYELKFENLSVNIFDRTINVFNATMLPREKPLNTYRFINSSFRLRTEKLTLQNVELFTLLKESQLKLERIAITKPDVGLVLAGNTHVFLPFKDSTAAAQKGGAKKKFIESFLLNEFQLIDASFHIVNFKKEREFEIKGFNISLYDLLLNQQTRKDIVSLRQLDLSLGRLSGVLKKGSMKRVSFKDFKVGIDSLAVLMTPDTVQFHFRDFNTGLKDLDLHTADSLFHLTMQSFQLSYLGKSIQLHEVSFTPNISDAEMQKRFTYQHTQASGAVGTVSLNQVNFDSLIYGRGLFVDEVVLDKPVVSIFKDNTKPVDKNHHPTYFGQQIPRIKMPLRIQQVKATNVQLTNVERKRDSSYAKVTLYRGTAQVSNITNLSRKAPLILHVSASIENKVPFNLTLGFSYSKPEFTFKGRFDKFDLPGLNGVIEAYTPAKIMGGVADEIDFSGTVYETYSSGTMKFLFHDLNVDLNLPKKAKWKSSVITFAANTALTSSNPASEKLPPRVVQFRTERDMNKGFINIVIKSALSGLKETMLMSKENKKAYREAKKQKKQAGK